jgi:hypothetical protein
MATTARGRWGVNGPIGEVDDNNQLATGELVPKDRYLAFGSATVATLSASQRLALHYFTAEKSEAITQVETYTGTVAAGATPTLCRVGVYEIAANGDGTLLAASANDTALWATVSTTYLKALTATFNKVAGQRYALAALIVTAAAIPILASPVSTLIVTQPAFALAPRLGGAITAQADLPASFVSGSVINSPFLFTVRLVP